MLTVNSKEHNGRLRKYYQITDAGRERITELLKEWEEIIKDEFYVCRKELMQKPGCLKRQPGFCIKPDQFPR